MVSHESIRQWCAKFGQTYANAPRRRRERPGDKWHLDEVFVKINGRMHYLWRVVITDKLGQLRDGATPGAAVGGSPSIEVSEQPSGELAPTYPAARTSDEKVYLSRACATVSVRVQQDIAALSTGPSPPRRRRIPPRNDRPIHHLERGHWHGDTRLTDRTGNPPRPIQPAHTLRQSQQVDGAVHVPAGTVGCSSLLVASEGTVHPVRFPHRGLPESTQL